MITITGLSRTRGRLGFSLPEVLIAMTLSSMLLAAVFSSWTFIARSNLSIANYSEMNTGARMGLEVFAKDVRTAEQISGDFTPHRMTLHFGEDASDEVLYFYDAEAQAVIRQTSQGREAVFEDVEHLELSRFMVTGAPATNPLGTKLIQIELRMVKPVLAGKTTQNIVSARYIMRNKRVSQ